MSDKKLDELDWVKVRQDFDSTYVTETIFQKAKRKTRENPLVPIGCLATTAALTYGLYNFYKGDSLKQQYMMRARILAQAFTVICVVTGIILIPKSN